MSDEYFEGAGNFTSLKGYFFVQQREKALKIFSFFRRDFVSELLGGKREFLPKDTIQFFETHVAALEFY